MAAPNTCPMTRVLSGLACDELSAIPGSQLQPPARSSSTTTRVMIVRLRFDIVPAPALRLTVVGLRNPRNTSVGWRSTRETLQAYGAISRWASRPGLSNEERVMKSTITELKLE